MRDAIWQSRLVANMNFRYWKFLIQKTMRNDKYAKLFLAITSSTTVIGWITGMAAAAEWWAIYVSVTWKILSGVNVLVAIWLQQMKYEEKIKDASSLVSKWGKLKRQYDGLWRQVENKEEQEIKKQPEIENQYNDISAKEDELVDLEVHFPECKRLLEKSYQQTQIDCPME